MRFRYWELLYKAMQDDSDIYCIVGDLGYGGADKIKNMFPERFINVGAAEQTMIGIACGLALEGKKPFCYSITPFLLYRPFEMLRTYVNHEQIPIRLIGSGRDKDYAHDGFSHDATDANLVLGSLSQIVSFFPDTTEAMELAFEQMLKLNKPSFISLSRKEAK